ncbi:hypothetical protein HNY73_002220 [Argiope bruennichi]|uniref:Uncharacterized protein n=1 Tax=Argiope bruennichi TaxID=94029 RepID=A0A8T0FX44_ARGBR|nr:hypothetical protein HNY73_002220 [Argiope bruennichi]
MKRASNASASTPAKKVSTPSTNSSFTLDSIPPHHYHLGGDKYAVDRLEEAIVCDACLENQRNQLGHDCITMNHDRKCGNYGDLALSSMDIEIIAKDFTEKNLQMLNYVNKSFLNNLNMNLLVKNTILLNHGLYSKNSQLASELYYKDTAGRFNIFDQASATPNERFNKRASLFKNRATVDMIGWLHVDIFNQDRLLLNLVDLKIKLIRSKPEFCLLGNERYKNILIMFYSLSEKSV